MAQERVERRLTAILAADVAGYSRLMGIDEEGTLARLKAHRKELIDPKITEHHGRIVKTTGDGLLVEFASVVDATRCAVEVQRAMVERNAEVPQNKRIEFRLGIHVGDIIIDGNDIFGDGVNIAARLEGIADPGGVCISDDTHRQIRGKFDISYDDMGLQTLKNIAEPMRAWRMQLDGDANSAKSSSPSTGSIQTLALPNRPSIAVLPFQNMSSDAAQEYFADGLVEDVIAQLARVPGFFVIARSSSFVYRNAIRDIRRVGRELGVRYVVKGSIRAFGKNVRISVQLVEAESGKQLWSKRFDVESESTFDLQDDITREIIRELEPELTKAELTVIDRRRTGNLDAWSRYRQALGAIALKGWNEEALAQAIVHLRSAIEIEPDFALAHAMVALLGAMNANLSFVSDTVEAQRQALRDAETAVALDPNASEVLGYAGCALSDIGESARGRELLERAIEIDPSNAQAHVALGAVQFQTHEYDAGIKTMQHGMRLSPRDAKLAFWGMVLAAGLAHADRLPEALNEAQNSCRRDSRLYGARVIMAFILARLGRAAEARAALTEARRIRPALSLKEIQRFFGRHFICDLEAIW